MAEVILTEKNFEEEVLKSDKPVLVDFWATWCGPCRMLAPTIEKIAEEQEDVVGVDLIHTRVFGNRIYVDIEISAEGSMSLEDSHAVAERVHDVIESSFPKVKHIMVHVNPAIH